MFILPCENITGSHTKIEYITNNDINYYACNVEYYYNNQKYEMSYTINHLETKELPRMDRDVSLRVSKVLPKFAVVHNFFRFAIPLSFFLVICLMNYVNLKIYMERK